MFDRVAKAFQAVADRQNNQDRTDTRTIVAILEEKRAEVMAKDRAGYLLCWGLFRSFPFLSFPVSEMAIE